MNDDLKRKAIVVRDSLTEFIAAAEDARMLRKRVIEQDLKIGSLKGRNAALQGRIKTMENQNRETKPRISEVFEENKYLRKKIEVLRGFVEVVSTLEAKEGLSNTALWHLVKAAERTMGKTDD